MANRKKRLKKGIASLKKQIEIHEEKKRIAREEGKVELDEYYERELQILEKIKNSKIKLLEKGVSFIYSPHPHNF